MTNKHKLISLILAIMVFGFASQAQAAKCRTWRECKERADEKEAQLYASLAKHPNVAQTYLDNLKIAMEAKTEEFKGVNGKTGQDFLDFWNKQTDNCAGQGFGSGCIAKQYNGVITFSGQKGIYSMLGDNGQPIFINGLGRCIGWGCLFRKNKYYGAFKKKIVNPPGSSPASSFSPLPSPSPGPAAITKFEITNFRLQEALNGEKYYQVLKEQMSINQPNYQLNIVWGAMFADTCTASCKYVKIDDYLADPNFDNLQAQPWPCSQNIDNQTTFAGDIDAPDGQAKTKPRENGIIQYTLSCQGPLGNDTKSLLVVIQSLQWFESIPRLDSLFKLLALR